MVRVVVNGLTLPLSRIFGGFYPFIYVHASIRKKTLSIIISVLAWEQLVNTQIHCFARFYR